MWLANTQKLAELGILRVSVVILGCAQSMCDSFNAVNNRASKIIGRVNSKQKWQI